MNSDQFNGCSLFCHSFSFSRIVYFQRIVMKDMPRRSMTSIREAWKTTTTTPPQTSPVGCGDQRSSFVSFSCCQLRLFSLSRVSIRRGGLRFPPYTAEQNNPIRPQLKCKALTAVSPPTCHLDPGLWSNWLLQAPFFFISEGHKTGV